MIDFAKRRKGLPRLGNRLRDGEEVRILAFGGGLTYDAYYLASMARMLATAYAKAIVETATRALPEFGSERAVFRARAALEMNPDIALVEFFADDAGSESSRTARAVEGIVRQLRSTDPDRELAFVYFAGAAARGDERLAKTLQDWERVADHYGIPSFDCMTLANWFVEKGVALWFERWPGRKSWDDRRPVALTYDGAQHTAGGGTLFGTHIAQAIITMCNPATLRTQSDLTAPLQRDHWGDAISVGAARLGGNGWVAGPIADILHTSPVAKCFSELSAAEREGARLRVDFNGRYAALWTLGTGGAISVAIDGEWRELPMPSDERHHVHELLDEDENRTHVLEIEARALPAVIAGLDVLGQVLPQVPSNG